MNRSKRHRPRKAVVGVERLDDRVVPTTVGMTLGPGNLIGPFIPGQTGFVGTVTPSMGVLHTPFTSSTLAAITHMPSPGPGGLFGPFVPGQSEVTGTISPTMGVLHTGLRLGGLQFSRFGFHSFSVAGLGPHVPQRFGAFFQHFVSLFAVPGAAPHMSGMI